MHPKRRCLNVLVSSGMSSCCTQETFLFDHILIKHRNQENSGNARVVYILQIVLVMILSYQAQTHIHNLSISFLLDIVEVDRF